MSKETKPFETWVIRNKSTGEYFTARSGKNAWKKPNHASSAWANSLSVNGWDSKAHVEKEAEEYGVDVIVEPPRHEGWEPSFRLPYFKEQDTWECVNIIENSLLEKLTSAEDLLKSIQTHCGDNGDPILVLTWLKDYFNE